MLTRRRFLVTLLAGGAAAWPRAGGARGAARGWVDEQTFGPFVVRANFPLGPLLPQLAELPTLQTDVAGTLAIPHSPEAIHVYLLDGEATYRRYLGSHLPDVPYRRALFVKAEGPGMVFAHRHPELPVDLRHECTHALLHAVLPMVPLWLDEGLAEYFEVPAIDRPLSHPHRQNLRWSLRWGRVTRISDLERRGTLAEMGEREYRDAWAWAHFLILGPPAARQELRAFLDDIRHHAPPGLLSLRLARRLGDLESQLAEHFKRFKG